MNTALGFVKEKGRATDVMKKFSFPLADINSDPEGYLLINTQNKWSGNKTEICGLDGLLETARDRANKLQRQIKTGIQVARDYMNKAGVSIKEYEKKLQEIERTVREPAPIYQRYSLITHYDGIKIDKKLYEQFKEQSFGDG